MAEFETLFLGNGLSPVDERGDMPLPPFIGELERGADPILIGPHETEPCLTAFFASHAEALYAESERRRLRDEAHGLPLAEHYARARRMFGQIEQAPLATPGSIRLTGWMRTRGRIERAALVLGTGATFEIWNPELARSSDDPELRQLAAYRLEQSATLFRADDQQEGDRR